MMQWMDCASIDVSIAAGTVIFDMLQGESLGSDANGGLIVSCADGVCDYMSYDAEGKIIYSPSLGTHHLEMLV